MRSEEGRQRLAASTAKLQSSSQTISDMQRMLAEIEDSATDSLVTVSNQGKQIQAMREKVSSINSEVKQGSTTITRMLRWSYFF